MRFDRLVLYCLILVLPVAIWPGSTSYDAAKFTLWGLAGACWLGSGAWRLASGRPLNLPPGRLAAAGGALLAVLALSAVAAPNTDLVGRTVILTTLWLAVVFQTSVAANSVSRMRDLLAASVLSGTLVALYGLAQIVGWIPGAAPASGYPPGISTLGNQNQVGGLAAVLLWPSFILWSVRPGLRRTAAIGATVLLAVTVVASRAVGPLIAVLGSFLVMAPAFLLMRSGRGRLVPPVLAATLILTAAGGAWLATDVMFTTPTADDDTPGIHHEVFRANHGAVRRTNWLVAREIFLSSPPTGGGAGNYPVWWPATRARLGNDPTISGLAAHEPVAAQAHNDAFQFLAETGLAGGLWMVVCGAAFLVFWSRTFMAQPEPRTRTTFLLLTAGLLTVGLHAQVSFPLHLPATSLMVAVIAGLMTSPVFSPGTTPKNFGRRSRNLAFAPGLLAVLLALGSVREFAGDLKTAAGRKLYIAGRLDQAEGLLAQGIAWQSWPGEGPLYLGLTEAGLGRTGNAEKSLENSLRLKPSFEGYLALAEISIDAGRFPAANELLTVVEDCEPFGDFRLQAAYLRGLAEARQGHRQQARRLFRDLLEDDPLNQRVWLALGYEEVLAGNAEEARVCYRRAVDIIESKIQEVRSTGAPGESGDLLRLGRHLTTAQKALDSLK